MQLTLPSCDVLCLSTLPPRADIDPLIEWLEANEERKVVVFDPGNPLPHPRMISSGRDRGSLQRLAKEQVFLNFDFVKQCDEDASLFATVEEMVEAYSLAASDFRHRGVDRLQNLLKNSFQFAKSRSAEELFGAFAHVPAIICGAGPSLDAQVPYLDLLQDRALIFAGGAALSRLFDLGGKAHFSGLIDPHPPRVVDKHPAVVEIPCFFQSRAHPEKLALFQSPLLWTPGCEQDFFEEKSFEVGWNVSTYLTAIACHLGCSPIILVGVDLCGDSKEFYSGGVEGADEAIELPSGLCAKRDWLLAARFLCDFAKRHPEVEWINASAGIEFEGFQKQKLQEVFFRSQYDLRGMVHAKISGIKPGVMEAFDRKEILEGLCRVSKLCEQLIGKLEKRFPAFSDQDGEYMILEVEIEREEVYCQFARPVWEVWEPVFSRSLSKDLPASEIGLKLSQWLFIKGVCDDAKEL